MRIRPRILTPGHCCFGGRFFWHGQFSIAYLTRSRCVARARFYRRLKRHTMCFRRRRKPLQRVRVQLRCCLQIKGRQSGVRVSRVLRTRRAHVQHRRPHVQQRVQTETPELPAETNDRRVSRRSLRWAESPVSRKTRFRCRPVIRLENANTPLPSRAKVYVNLRSVRMLVIGKSEVSRNSFDRAPRPRRDESIWL